MGNSPSNASVILTAFFTSLLTAVITVLVIYRLNLLPGAGDKAGVPDLSGLKQYDAQVNLETQGLVLMIGGRKADPKLPPGTVVSQSPYPGSKVNRGTTVTVILAGEAPIVPDLKGRTIAEATLLLEQAGFKIQVGEPVPDDSAPKGRIASQVPPAGAAYESGRTITVITSAGPATVTVPKLVRLSLNRAKQVIQEAGFKVGDVRWVYSEDWDPYIVLGQEPKENEKAKLGSAVDLVVNPE